MKVKEKTKYFLDLKRFCIVEDFCSQGLLQNGKRQGQNQVKVCHEGFWKVKIILNFQFQGWRVESAVKTLVALAED